MEKIHMCKDNQIHQNSIRKEYFKSPTPLIHSSHPPSTSSSHRVGWNTITVGSKCTTNDIGIKAAFESTLN